MNASTRSNWLLYGAYGGTGRLVLEEALRRGHRPVLGGRDGARLAVLGQAHGLKTLSLPLDNAAALRAALSTVSTVLNAAGPFAVTGPQMRAACLAAGCSYIDVSGEIDDFEAALACDDMAHRAGIAIIPGAGYGVVFAESLAGHLSRRLPDATWLRLSLDTQTTGRSRGALLSVASAIASGGREMHENRLRRRAFGFSMWRAPDPGAGKVNFAAAPMAELVAAQRSTGIPNIVAGIPLSRAAATVMRLAGPLLARLIRWQAARAPRANSAGASDATSATLRSRVWGEVGNAAGIIEAAMLETGEGYRSAAVVAVRAIELQMSAPRVGALTPAQAFGADFALLAPGTRIQALSRA